MDQEHVVALVHLMRLTQWWLDEAAMRVQRHEIDGGECESLSANMERLARLLRQYREDSKSAGLHVVDSRPDNRAVGDGSVTPIELGRSPRYPSLPGPPYGPARV